MRIESIRFSRLRIPFRAAFAHAAAVRLETQGVIVEVRTASGALGYGESAPREYVTGETLAGTLAEIDAAIPRLRSLTIGSIEEIDMLFDGVGPGASTAIELALLDAWRQEQGKPLVDLLGGAKLEALEYSAVIESTEGAALEGFLQKVKRFGFKQAKVKLTRDAESDRRRIAQVRAILGDHLVLRGDANACWSPSEARERLPELADLGIGLVEEPVARSDRGYLPQLRRDFGHRIGIMADESLCSFDDAAWLIHNQAVTAFNLKIGKHGGLLPSLELHRLARKTGIDCQLGCFVGETSILATAGATLGALTGDLISHEGATAALLLEHDVVDQPLMFGPGGIVPVAAIDALRINLTNCEVKGHIAWQ